jgi:hypothetical protein
MTILGVLFVNYSARGHQLVFSYPEINKEGKFLGFEPEFLADILSPKSQLCDKRFHLRVEKIDFLGHPTLLNVDRPSQGLIYSRKIQKMRLEKESQLVQLTMFHIVFVLGNCNQNEIDLIYEHCLLKITSAFKFEQLKRGYIKSETQKIISIREDYPKEQQNEEIMKQSSLAQTLTLVYNSMRGKIGTQITINKSVRVSIQPNLEHLKALSRPIVSGFFKSKYPTMRPYYSLLFSADPKELISTLPKDSSPFLRLMIESLTPTTSFEELQTSLGCSLGQLYKCAAHLHYWGCARIIQSINTRNFYRISESADFGLLTQLNNELQSMFPTLDTVSFLRDLSVPRPLHSVIPGKESRHVYLDAITYLLKRDFVVQMSMYLVLIVPSSILEKVQRNHDMKQIIIPDPKNPTPFEKSCIQLMVANQHNPIIKAIFERFM